MTEEVGEAVVVPARRISLQAIIVGCVAALVGYASSAAVVLQGLSAVGASPAQAASGLFAVCFGMGFLGFVIAWRLRQPVAIAWTTPGAALLAATGAVAGGFPAAVGAFLAAAALIVLAGLWRPLGRLAEAIPAPIANAMLAGVLLQLCLAPFLALTEIPLMVAPVLLLWLLVGRVWPLAAVPVAAVAAVVLIALTTEALEPVGGSLLPAPQLVMPVFTLEALVSIGLPLFLVTMASQNIPGAAVLAAHGFRPPLRPLLVATGLGSGATAALGGPSLNLAAITAALCAGPEAEARPALRYQAAMAMGGVSMLLALLSPLAVALVQASPPVLIQAVAGLALMSAFGASAVAGFRDEPLRLAALVTFLTTASGLSISGVGSAFWGLLLGLAVHYLYRRPVAAA